MTGQPKPYDLMVDIETLGTSSNAFIVQISAAVFDEDTIVDEFEHKMDVWTEQMGAEMDSETFTWWQKRPDDIKRGVLSGTSTLRTGLVNLNMFFKTYKVDYAWANSPSFDMVILQNAFKREGLPCYLPPFYKWLDLRTAKYFYNLATPHEHMQLPNSHNALDDVRNQINAIRLYKQTILGN